MPTIKIRHSDVCRDVVLLIGGYAIIAFTYCLHDELVPLFASTPLEHDGLAMNSSQLGVPLSIGGVMLMFIATCVYPHVQRRVGSFTCTRLGLASMVGIALLYPCCALIAQQSSTATFVTFTVVTCVRNASGNFAFAGSMVMLNVVARQSAHGQVGRVNGIGQALASLVRAIGPAMGGSLWSLSVATAVPGSPFIVFGFVSVSAIAGYCLYFWVGQAVTIL
jgi:hypothetical protein